jgi:hypothetical protein
MKDDEVDGCWGRKGEGKEGELRGASGPDIGGCSAELMQRKAWTAINRPAAACQPTGRHENGESERALNRFRTGPRAMI